MILLRNFLRVVVCGSSFLSLVAGVPSMVAGDTSHSCKADWPQILGPNRDSIAIGERIDPWSAPPKVRWAFDCGAGYAGPAVVDGRVYLWHRVGNQEVLDCLDRETGKRLWNAQFPTSYRGGVDPDLGPRCVPVVFKDRVIVYGAAGSLHAVRTADGEVLWSRELMAELGGDEGYFGAGSTPLVIDDTVVVEVGSEAKAGLLGLDMATGATRWQSLSSEASYASPVTMEMNGKTLVVAPMRLSTYLVDPRDGTVQREFSFGRRGPSVVAATPLVDGTHVFMTAAYGDGCRKMDLDPATPRNLWKDTEVISSQYASPVLVEGNLYAITGREDFNNAGLVCVDWSTGKSSWAEPSFGTAHMIGVEDRVLAIRVQGKLDLFAADPQKFTLLSRAPLPEGTYRALPALDQGLLFCRRTQGSTRGQLLAVDLNEASGN